MGSGVWFTAALSCAPITRALHQPHLRHLRHPRAGLLYVGAVTYAVALLAATAVWRPLLTTLEIIELPTAAMKASIVGLIVADAVVCFAWETTLRGLLGVGIPVSAA